MELEIEVYRTNGAVDRFVQTDEKANRELITQFDPNHLFEEAGLSIACSQALSFYPSSQISCVLLRIEPDPCWHMPVLDEVSDIREINEMEYHELTETEGGTVRLREEEIAPKHFYHGVVRMHLAGGIEKRFEIRTGRIDPENQVHILEQFMDRRTIFFKGDRSRYLLINTRNIIQLELIPPHIISPRTWHVELGELAER